MSRPRALEDVRVVDFSWVRAGPWATRCLGAFGAEIIKIEWPENERGRLPSSTTPHDLEVNLNTSGNFNDTNVNKKSLSLNVRSAKGLEIMKRLIAISDIVSVLTGRGRHHPDGRPLEVPARRLHDEARLAIGFVSLCSV